MNARATAAPKSSPSEVPRHYPGGWQPPGSGATGAMGAMGAMSTSLPEARKAEALGQEMWELQRLRMRPESNARMVVHSPQYSRGKCGME